MLGASFGCCIFSYNVTTIFMAVAVVKHKQLTSITEMLKLFFTLLENNLTVKYRQQRLKVQSCSSYELESL